MNKLELSNVDASKGYPFSIDDLRFMLDGKTSGNIGTANTGIYSAIESSAKALGDNYIVCGCEIYNPSQYTKGVYPGWVVLDGELLYYPGQTLVSKNNYYYFFAGEYEKKNNGKKYKNGVGVPEVYYYKNAQLVGSSSPNSNDFMFCRKVGSNYKRYENSIKLDNKANSVDIIGGNVNIKLDVGNDTEYITLDSGKDGHIKIDSGNELNLLAEGKIEISSNSNGEGTNQANESLNIKAPNSRVNIAAGKCWYMKNDGTLAEGTLDGDVNISGEFIYFSNNSENVKTYIYNNDSIGDIIEQYEGFQISESFPSGKTVLCINVNGALSYGDDDGIGIRCSGGYDELYGSGGINADNGFKIEVYHKEKEVIQPIHFVKLTRKNADSKYKNIKFSGIINIIFRDIQET